MKRLTTALVGLCMAALCSACTEPAAPNTPTLASISVAIPSATLQVGQSITATASGVDQNGAPFTLSAITWSATTPVTVDQTGKITAVSPGSATVTATVGAISGQTAVAVSALPATALAFATPLSNTANNRVALTQQPVVKLVNVNGGAVAQAGVQITATVSSGSIIGSSAVTTDANGVAVFAGLALSGTVGNRTLVFTASGLTSASTTVALSAGLPASISINAGNQQTAEAGATVPVAPSVVVTDADANVVPGASVLFDVTSGGGTVTGSPATTNANGIATLTSWKLGSPGLNSVQAHVVNVSNGVAFSALATQAPALQSIVVSVSPGTIQVGQTTQATASGVDQYGAPIATGTLTWSTSSAVASVSAQGVVTGMAAGQVIVTATAAGKSGQAIVSVLAVPTLTTLSVALSSSSIQTGQTAQASATAFDQFGAVMLGTPITWSSSSASATVTSSGLVTGVSNGSATIIASAAGKTAGALLTVTAAPVVPVLTTLQVSVNPASIAIGATSQASAVGRDQLGNVIGTGNITWSATGSATINANGVITGVSSGNATITATAGAISAQAAITVVSNTPGLVLTSMSISTPGTSVLVGSTLQATVLGRDQNGAAYPTGALVWSATGTAATVSQTGLITGVLAGLSTVRATAQNGVTISTDVTVTGGNGPSALTDIIVTVPTTLAVGQTVRVLVQGVDQYGAATPVGPVAFYSDPLYVATFTQFGDITGVHPGTSTISIVATTATGSIIKQSTVTVPGAPTAQLRTVLPLATVTNRTPINWNMQVEIFDIASGQPVSWKGVPITATLTGGSGVLIGTTLSLTEHWGAAYYSGIGIQGTTGPHTVTFSAPGIVSGTWQFDVLPAAAAAVAINAGNNQTASVSTAVATNPSVKVTDADGNAVSGVAVNFTVTGGGGSLTNVSATTNASGIAQATWTLGGNAGTNTLSVAAAGIGSPVIFTATATSPMQ